MLLDYSIESAKERLDYINDLIANYEGQFTPAQLEAMGEYLVFGKDETGHRLIRMNPPKKEANAKSIDASLEAGLEPKSIDEKFKSMYVYPRNPIDPIRDAEVPGMRDCWEGIKRLKHCIDVSLGKEDDPNVMLLTPYQIAIAKKWLIDMRQNQYDLREAFRPTLHFIKLSHSNTPKINFDSDSAYWISLDEWREKIKNTYFPIPRELESYETRETPQGTEVRWVVRHQKFDWENPSHIAALIRYYSAIYQEDWDDLESWGRTLIYDFDRYSTMANLSPERTYILTRRIDGAPYSDISDELAAKFNFIASPDRISAIVTEEIPRTIAMTVHKHKIINDPTFPTKRCRRCDKDLPLSPIFFPINKMRKDGYVSICRDCQRLKATLIPKEV